MFKRAAVGLAALAAFSALAACGTADQGAGRVEVVATTTIMGDLVRNVVGADGTVDVLIPVGADPHDFQPSARQVASIETADLVVANGLSLEEGLDDVLDAAIEDGANVLRVGELLNPLPFAADDGTSAFDPHIWNDPLRMADAVAAIGEELARLDPAIDWRTRAAAYAAELEATDAAIQEILAPVPTERRVLVSNHASLGYFAARYGFEIGGVVIPGGSTMGAPSSASLADLVDEILALGVRSILVETTSPQTLAEAVAAEAGRAIELVEVYSGSLGEPGSGAESLIDMLLTNARRIAAAAS